MWHHVGTAHSQHTRVVHSNNGAIVRDVYHAKPCGGIFESRQVIGVEFGPVPAAQMDLIFLRRCVVLAFLRRLEHAILKPVGVFLLQPLLEETFALQRATVNCRLRVQGHGEHIIESIDDVDKAEENVKVAVACSSDQILRDGQGILRREERSLLARCRFASAAHRKSSSASTGIRDIVEESEDIVGAVCWLLQLAHAIACHGNHLCRRIDDVRDHACGPLGTPWRIIDFGFLRPEDPAIDGTGTEASGSSPCSGWG
mmetsp:Transcript_51263/g.122892  ORF Transcript_51263/g.122892 Transcript_51263/m.122892 type:complete len:257 (+) Transcript_51263:281-1051(+)